VISLALAEQNTCQYCVSAHTAMSSKSGLTGAEMDTNCAGTSQNTHSTLDKEYLSQRPDWAFVVSQ